MVTLQDCLDVISKRNINPKDVRIWICIERDDNNNGLEKTFGYYCDNMMLDLDKDLRFYIKKDKKFMR